MKISNVECLMTNGYGEFFDFSSALGIVISSFVEHYQHQKRMVTQ